MCRRRRLSDLIKWWVVGWMKMGLAQADAARRLNVSRSVAQRLWDQFESENSIMRIPVPARLRVATSEQDRLVALSIRRKRIIVTQKGCQYMLLWCANFFTIKDSMQDDTLRASFLIDDTQVSVSVRQESKLPKSDSIGFLTHQDKTQFALMSNSRRVRVWREYTYNKTLSKDRVIEVWNHCFGLNLSGSPQ